MIDREEKYHIRLFSDSPDDILAIQKALAGTNIHFEVYRHPRPLWWKMLKEGIL